MRWLMLLAILALAASAPLASRVREARPGDLPEERFVGDPRARIEEGLAKKRLGETLMGYEDLLEEDPDDLDALRGRIGAGVMIGAVAFGQPGVPELVGTQIDGYVGPHEPRRPDCYLARREELDPDGRFLEKLLADWLDARLRFDTDSQMGFYARSSAAIFSAARGDKRGVDALFDLAAKGEYYLQFFPWVRSYHPNWRAVEPMVRHYLEQGELAGRVLAGATLLDYHLVFGVGKELLDRHLEDIRAAVKEVRSRMRAGRIDRPTSESGRDMVLCMSLLAALGDEQEKKLLEQAGSPKELRYYAGVADTVRVARLAIGADDFDKYRPTSQRYLLLHVAEQQFYFVAAGYRAAMLEAAGRKDSEEYRQCMQLLLEGFDGGAPQIRVFAMQATGRLEPEFGRTLIQRALNERGTIGIYGAVLSEDLEDPVPILLPALRSPAPDVAALVATSLLDLGDSPALQR